jgi:hypothetical protein
VNVLILLLLFAAVATTWGIRRLQARELRELMVAVQASEVVVGPKRMPTRSIARIDIAPLYDVAPADDLWVLADEQGTEIFFFGRDPGAPVALAALETMLADLNVEQALQVARNSSVFEQRVVVWQR